MKVYCLVNRGMEKVAQQEITELIQKKSLAHPLLLEVDASKEEIFILLTRGQSFRRLLIGFGQAAEVRQIPLDKIGLQHLFFPDCKFKIEVEGVKGQENRFDLARNLAGRLFPIIEKNIKVHLELKKPQLLVVGFHNGQDFFVGVDLAGKELNARPYRVFPHQASFKGDLGYYLARKSGFLPGKKLVVGFMKDGVVAIEAAIFANKYLVHNPQKENFSCSRFPLFAGMVILPLPPGSEIIDAFDENTQNFTAARKNAQLAGVEKNLQIQKIALDELDVRYEPESVDHLIFHLTAKDEDKINEIFHQAGYILKKKGRLLLITRQSFEVSAGTAFTLLEQETIVRGDSPLVVWVMEKKAL